ncbi:MAG: hypothetical protein KDB02_04455 [Acidimicrobiales bacterium]|nr:hypothetical protein [Acidimicrobiales bacterium]
MIQGVVQWLGLDRRYPADMRAGLGWLANPFTGVAVISQFLLNMAFLASTAWWLLAFRRRRSAAAPAHRRRIPTLASVAFAMVWASALFNPFFTAWLVARLLVPMVPAQLVAVALTWQERRADRARAVFIREPSRGFTTGLVRERRRSGWSFGGHGWTMGEWPVSTSPMSWDRPPHGVRCSCGDSGADAHVAAATTCSPIAGA